MLDNTINFGKKKKKPRNRNIVQVDSIESAVPLELNTTEGDTYSYEYLLKRAKSLCPPVKRSRFIMKPPVMIPLGTKKSCWLNSLEISEIMRRPISHLQDYFKTELGTDISTNPNGSLIIKGRYKSDKIESILKKYIRSYVICESCRSPHTIIEKDKVSKLKVMKCSECNSTRRIEKILSGFKAETRAGRRAKRNTFMIN